MIKALEIEGLRKTYRNGFEALRGIDLQVTGGDFFGLLGPNGAGKSTTIGIATALIVPSAGRVRIYGHDIVTQPEAARACTGLVPQEFNFNMFEPVVEILVNQAGYYGIPRRRAFERAERCLRELGLWDKRRQMARQLSGGLKRRLMIARALVHEPRLLILDEPTAGVDIELRRSMWRFLREINAAGTTIILTTHYLEEAETLCRNLAIIDHGRIVENTDVKTLLTRLHIETFVLNLRRPLEAAPDIPGYTLRFIDESTLEVDVPKEEGINSLFSVLSSRGIEVISMRNKANRLEELFIRMVEQSQSRRAAGSVA